MSITMGSIGNWEQVVAEKRTLRDKSLTPYMVSNLDERGPRVDNVQERSCLDDSLAQNITDIDSIPTLLEQLRAGKYTAEQATHAYIRRCVPYRRAQF
ncbi:uncharacterized protein BDW43DRAFT_294581 [Aspergillus alliaceus]|uniref:uncharacterized protein n=1 Tax=Petromyces alliaceus TaxID=209559 RepID=UPI0012A615BA|nr:uncharacterized protein BDW43DRAFT_294581 [Aspergillus alliaceus]KAB8227248.1 hypothetical protein BDW43DRAFT_294581 [Aspergillus alliaceus]